MGLITLVVFLFLNGCREEPLPVQTSELNRIVNLYEGPVTQFEKACAGCHGNNGIDYPDDFRQMSDSTLGGKVRAMMEKSSQLMAPTEDEINAMIEYHRALRDGRLFVIINNAQSFLENKENQLTGNVTPGATVFLQKDGKTFSAGVDNEQWSIQAGFPPPFTVIAQKDGQEISFQFPDRQSTHGK